MRFVDGHAYDEDFIVDSGPMNVVGLVSVKGEDVTLTEVAFYPLTSAKLQLGVKGVLEIFRIVCEQAKEEGFATCSLSAYRASGARPGRMMNRTRRLR